MQFSSMSSLGSSMRRWKSSMLSNTTARARCCISFGVAAEGLMMAPSGQRLPRSTAMPASFLNGDFKLWITSRFQHGASLLFSQTVLPLPGSGSRCSRQAAGVIEILHQVLARGHQIDQRMHAAAEPVEVVEVQIDADAVREGGQMNHRIGRAADRRQGADRVLECVPGEDPGERN